jgi:hypothetical protein
MTSSIGFYSGPSDTVSLQKFAESIGLILISFNLATEFNEDAEIAPGCYLSLVAASELHPYGNPPTRLTDARDPLIFFLRGYFKNPYLVAGQIHWSDDAPAIAALTKPYYKKLSKWIEQHWKLRSDSSFYIGPEAESLLDLGAQRVNVLPGQAKFTIVYV